MSEIEKAIEQLKIKKNDMELCVGLIKSGNQFVPKQSTPLMKAIGKGIEALQEKQERGKGCKYCREERDVHKAQSVDCWKIDGSEETREKFASKFCGNCGRDLRKGKNDG